VTDGGDTMVTSKSVCSPADKSSQLSDPIPLSDNEFREDDPELLT